MDYLTRSKKEEEIRQRYIKGLQVPPGPPTQHGIYASPEWTKQPYPSIDWEAISQNQEPPQGWPRYPRFNEPGDVPGPPVQFGPPITNNNVKAGFNFIPNGVEEKNLCFYHPDHLGSSSYITDKNGEVIQHTEYIAFGEVLVDEHSTTNKMPYLFNGKELDYETGLYYYGARYYDPKVSIFLNVDPLVEKTGTPYAYTYNNPINLIDPTGMESEGWGLKDNKWEWKSDLTAENYKELGYSDYRDDGSIITNTAIAGKENENTGLTYLGYEGYTSYISHSNATISLWDGDRGFLGNWANSDNFLGKISYNIANNFYLAAQVVDFDLLGKNHINPMTGSRAYTNIDGTPQYNAGDRAFAFASVFNPISPKFIPKSDLKISKEILTPLTASQFSKTFKGTFLAKAPPSVRGYINRKINFILDKLNNVNTAKSSVVGTSKLIKGTNKNEKD